MCSKELQRFDIPQRVSSARIREIAAQSSGKYILIYTKPTELRWVDFGLERLIQVAESTVSPMVYSDHFASVDGEVTPAPVIDCQEGALRDDFDFGGVLLFRTEAFRAAAARMTSDYEFAGLYDLRLKIQEYGAPVHVNEFLYYEVELDTRKSGEKLFDYVDPRNRAVQIEMEQACTEHLKAVGAYLEPVFKTPDLSEGDFEYEASVVIPCKNRVRTIGDAISSALNQNCTFKYNVIVVDDNSTDGTVDVIRSFSDNPRLVYIAQDSGYHAIGGNWNAALHHPKCGRFALQLDSDDIYSGPDTVQKFIDAFYAQNCAMVIGTYRITDFNLNELPPGVIDHKEWTDENGRNNALRINGLGAPRGFWTPLARSINFPTTKYGEDYAVALRISREYRIGRIYDVMYNCRRWDDNSDAALSIEKTNANNLYKDRIRTWEMQARIEMNRERSFEVAGHLFSIKLPQKGINWDMLENYRPFATATDKHPLFGIKVRNGWNQSRPEGTKEVLIQETDPDEPRVDLYSCGDEWWVELAPMRRMQPVAALRMNGDFSQGMLLLSSLRYGRFAIDNASMLMFAFATSCLKTLEMHSSVVVNAGKGYMFLAPSGTGKSTHSRMWIENIDGSVLLNDDNPVVRLGEDGKAVVYGSPWSGKTPCYRNESAEIGAMVRIRRCAENRITALKPLDAYACVASSSSGFKALEKMADGLHETLSSIAMGVPCYVLDCLPDAEAAYVCSKEVKKI